MTVHHSNRKAGVAADMYTRAIQAIGPNKVNSISGELGALNREIYNQGIKKGLNPVEAVMQTPAAKLRIQLGYDKISFDQQNLIITGSRN